MMTPEIGAMQPEFGLEVLSADGRVLVRALGEIDLATAGKVQSTIDELLDHGSATVVVDLQGVTFLDSSGIGALIGCHQRATELGSELWIRIGDSPARRPLELTGALEYLHVELDDKH